MRKRARATRVSLALNPGYEFRANYPIRRRKRASADFSGPSGKVRESAASGCSDSLLG